MAALTDLATRGGMNMTGLRFTAVDVAPLRVPEGFLHALAAGEIATPTAAFIIEHPKHGLIVYDTGMHPAISDPEASVAHFGQGVREAFGAEGISRDHAIDRQLIRLGYRPDDVKYVIYSHLHLDHAGGMTHFPNATHVVQRDELRYAWWPDRWTRAVYCNNDLQGTRHFDFLELGGDFDLFQDGTMQLVRMPGHSPGHQVLMLDLPHRGKVCLAADVAHLRSALNEYAPMPWDHDVGENTMSHMKLRAIERGGVRVLLSHDPADFAAMPKDGTFWD